MKGSDILDKPAILRRHDPKVKRSLAGSGWIMQSITHRINLSFERSTAFLLSQLSVSQSVSVLVSRSISHLQSYIFTLTYLHGWRPMHEDQGRNNERLIICKLIGKGKENSPSLHMKEIRFLSSPNTCRLLNCWVHMSRSEAYGDPFRPLPQLIQRIQKHSSS